MTALRLFPSSLATRSASSARSGGREMVFFTASPMSEALPARQDTGVNISHQVLSCHEHRAHARDVMEGSGKGESRERERKKPAGGVKPHPRARKSAGSPNVTVCEPARDGANRMSTSGS